MRAFVILIAVAIIVGILAVRCGWTRDVTDCTYDSYYHTYDCPPDQ